MFNLLIDYIKSATAFFGIELLTMLIGFYYLASLELIKAIRVYIYFISFGLIFKLLALYYSIYFSGGSISYMFMHSVHYNTSFWMFNVFDVCFVVFHLYYFGGLLINKSQALFLKVSAVIFAFGSVLFFTAFPNSFYIQSSTFVHIGGCLFLIISMSLYLLDILKRDTILKNQERFSLFVVGAVGLYTMSRLPFSIYALSYNSYANQEFMQMYVRVFQVINTVVFIIYIIGFNLCLSKKRA